MFSHAIAVAHLQHKPYDKAYKIVAMLLCIPALPEWLYTSHGALIIPTLYVVDHSIDLPRVEALLLLRRSTANGDFSNSLRTSEIAFYSSKNYLFNQRPIAFSNAY